MFSTDCFVCMCMILLSSCLVNGLSTSVTSASDTSTSDTSNIATSTILLPSGTSATGTFSTLSSSPPPLNGSDPPTGNTPSTSSSLSRSAENSTESDNNTNTSPQSTTTTTTPSTTTTIRTTTPMLIFCKNGTCSGNDSSCLNETITDTCLLSGPQSCQQIVFTNTTDTYYEVGCFDSCEFLVEETDVVTMTTRCCDTNMCNNELLSDPDQGNSGVQIHVSCFLITLLIYLSRMFS